jgi:hypothetical protein
MTEEQLRQERVAHQQAEAQLQQERTALAKSWAALEREHLAREEAQGQLQQERAALEGARVTLKQRDDEVSRLNGELPNSLSRTRTCASPSRSRKPQFSTCGRRLKTHVPPSRRR